jgi:hypothetical protein
VWRDEKQTRRLNERGEEAEKENQHLVFAAKEKERTFVGIS